MTGAVPGPFAPVLPVTAPEGDAPASPRRREFQVGGPLCPGCYPERFDENGVRPEFAHFAAFYGKTGAE